MSTYGQYCPIARASELFADRWTPLIIRELLNGEHRFNDLERGLPGISRSLLAARLDRLERADIVERRARPGQRTKAYWLTERGEELRSVVEALGQWGATWAFSDPRPEETDPKLLLWWMRRRINTTALPDRRVVARFDFRGVRTPFWLLFDRPESSVCLSDPGFEVDLVVDADLSELYRVWLGRSDWSTAVAAGRLTVDGPPRLAQALPRWLALSHYAPAVRAGMTRRRQAATLPG